MGIAAMLGGVLLPGGVANAAAPAVATDGVVQVGALAGLPISAVTHQPIIDNYVPMVYGGDPGTNGGGTYSVTITVDPGTGACEGYDYTHTLVVWPCSEGTPPNVVSQVKPGTPLPNFLLNATLVHNPLTNTNWAGAWPPVNSISMAKLAGFGWVGGPSGPPPIGNEIAAPWIPNGPGTVLPSSYICWTPPQYQKNNPIYAATNCNYKTNWQNPTPGPTPPPPVQAPAPAPTPLRLTTVQAVGGGTYQFSAMGNVFNHGGARWFGSLAAAHLPTAVVALVPVTNGYFLVTAKGNVYNFGGAKWYGSAAAKPLPSPIASIAVTATGYTLTSQTGQTYNF